MPREQIDANEPFYVIAAGLVAMSVCVPEEMPTDEVERLANSTNPTGISSPWSISEDEHFHTGQTNPCQCPDAPGRVHRLLNC
jgi:hypothetical protein